MCEDIDQELEQLTDAQSQRIQRLRQRLMRRGLEESEAAQEAESWVRENILADIHDSGDP